ncbi:MAG: Fic family protein [Planctomycetes bacterium]|nr:Fic family protein [Planctomycetota bacterium]
MTFVPKFTITHRMTSGITQIERARGFLEAARLSADWVREMSNRALIREAHHTTHIEGTQLSLEDSEKLWRGEEVPGADPDDTRELLNYRSAFDLVSGCMETGDPITEGLIREIHRCLVEGVRGGSAAPGEYRRTQNYVVNSRTGKIIYTPPTAVDVPILMSDLVKWLNSAPDVHPVLQSGIAQFQLVHIHPFLDGNGRASRLLSTLCLYKAGYDFKRLFTFSEFYDRDRPAFYKAIQSVREQDMDMTTWLDYFIAGLETQMVEVKDKGQRIIRSDILTKQRDLNVRQGKALAFLLAEGCMNIHDYENLCPDVAKRTLQRDLKILVEKQLIVEKGSGATDPNRNYELDLSI